MNDAVRDEIVRVLLTEDIDPEEARHLARALVREIDWSELDR